MSNTLRAFQPDRPSIPSGTLTVRQVVAMYLEDLAERIHAKTCTRDHFTGVKYHVDQFASFFGDNLLPTCRRADTLLEDNPDLPACRQHDVTQWIANNPGWEAAATKKRAMIDLLACFNWAKEEELILRNPYHTPKSFANMPYTPRRPAEQVEYVTLMRHGCREIRRVLYLLRRSGIRTKESRELLWTDLRLDHEFPHIYLAKNKTFARTGEPRLIGLDPSAARFLANLQRHAKPGQTHVFLNCEGKPWTRHTMCRHIRRLADRLGLDENVETRVTAYCIRHQFTVDGIECGATGREIADQLGQAGTNLVDAVYGRKSRQRVKHLNRIATKIARRGK